MEQNLLFKINCLDESSVRIDLAKNTQVEFEIFSWKNKANNLKKEAKKVQRQKVFFALIHNAQRQKSFFLH